MELILGLAAAAVGGAGLAFAGFEALYRKRDAGTIRLDTRARTPWQEITSATPSVRHFICHVPFVNDNRLYEQTLVNVTADVQVLARDAASPRQLQGWATVKSMSGDRREDGYWAATLLGPGERSDLELHVEIEAPFGLPLHAAMVKVRFSTYGRRDLLPFEEDIVLPLAAVKPLPAAVAGETVSIQCVPTHILTDIDDIVDVIDRYTRNFRQPGDIVAVAESVVAITQHQYFRPTEVQPGFWARRLCYFVPSKGSLSSPHGYQLAMNQVGAFRMVSSFFIGAVAKVFGKKGVFYELAGKPAELIDDITGTMPPFDKYIVAGPKDPQGVVDRIKQRTGMEAAIVDANDLKRAMVLACTSGANPADVSRMLLDNPFGNAAEQTPVVVLRPLTAAGQGSTQRDQIRSV